MSFRINYIALLATSGKICSPGMRNETIMGRSQEAKDRERRNRRRSWWREDKPYPDLLNLTYMWWSCRYLAATCWPFNTLD